MADDYLKFTRTPPLSRFEIKAGWEIPAALEQALNSDLPGELNGLVMSNAYDTATGQCLLIPQGARLVGAYNSRVGYAQSGVQVAWPRVIFPEGSAIRLNGVEGLNAQGNAGLRDKADHHYKQLFGSAVLTSMFDAALAATQSRQQSVLVTPSVGDETESAACREVSQLGAQITRKNFNVQPTIKIPAGYKFNVMVNRDILFEEPYQPVQPQANDVLIRRITKMNPELARELNALFDAAEQSRPSSAEFEVAYQSRVVMDRMPSSSRHGSNPFCQPNHRNGPEI